MAKRKYGRITVEGKDIPEDEPLFLIRGQDVLSVFTILQYANSLALTPGKEEAATEIRRYAAEVEAWQAANPDRVKVPD